jgi:3-oxoadipate enol-lactonase
VSFEPKSSPSAADKNRTDPAQVAFYLAGRGTSAMTGLANHVMFGRLVGAGVRYESLVRRAFNAPPAALLGPLNRRRKTIRARQKEFDQRPCSASRNTAGGRPPVAINWHEGGSGPPLVLINGWTASGLMWPKAWVAALEKDFRVIRPDNRGSGWSRHAPLPCTIADMADDTMKLMKHLGIDSAVVLGLSMGGMIAQELAIRHPSAVTGLILTSTRPPSPLQLMPPAAVLQTVMRPPAAGESIAQYHRSMWPTFAGPGFVEKQSDLVDEMIAQILLRPTPRRLMLDQARAVAAWVGASRLAKIATPTVVVHGSADLLMPVGNGVRLAQAISGASYVELRGVGHLTPYEAPEQLSKAIRRVAVQ